MGTIEQKWVRMEKAQTSLDDGVFLILGGKMITC
jgi:hypothetical protein